MSHGHFPPEWFGKKVKDSPIGPGEVSGVTAARYPQVNGVAVAWLEFEDGTVFDPFLQRSRHRTAEE